MYRSATDQWFSAIDLKGSAIDQKLSKCDLQWSTIYSGWLSIDLQFTNKYLFSLKRIQSVYASFSTYSTICVTLLCNNAMVLAQSVHAMQHFNACITIHLPFETKHNNIKWLI